MKLPFRKKLWSRSACSYGLVVPATIARAFARTDSGNESGRARDESRLAGTRARVAAIWRAVGGDAIRESTR